MCMNECWLKRVMKDFIVDFKETASLGCAQSSVVKTLFVSLKRGISV